MWKHVLSYETVNLSMTPFPFKIFMWRHVLSYKRVNLIMTPFFWQKRRRRTGHRCDSSFIPVSQRKIAESGQPQTKGEQPENQRQHHDLSSLTSFQFLHCSVRVQESRSQWCDGILGPTGPVRHRTHRRRSLIHPGGGVHAFQFFYAGSADRGERRLNGAF